MWAHNTLLSAGRRYDGGVKPKFNVNQVAIAQVMFEGTVLEKLCLFFFF